MRVPIPLVRAVLPLGASLNDIKAAIADNQRHEIGFADSDEFALFQPKLDSDWGPLHHGLVSFIHTVRAGAWQATASQHAPTSLVGDFGEYFLAKQWCDHLAPGGSVVRVVRARGLKRPDFVIWDPRRERLIALECKTSVVNAASVAQQALGRRNAALTLCALTKERRSKGMPQICVRSTPDQQAVVLPQHAPTLSPPGRHVTDYGESRVLANASVVGTLIVPDGRLESGRVLGGVRVHHPQRCETTCMDCAAGVSRVHVAFFTNSTVEVSPLLPDSESRLAERAFQVQLMLARARWSESTLLFERGLEQLTDLANTLAHGAERQQRLRYVTLLLDAVAAGLEARLADPVHAFELVREGFELELAEACAAQSDERPDGTEDGPHLGILTQVDPDDRAALMLDLRARTDESFSSWAEHFFVEAALDLGPRVNVTELIRLTNLAPGPIRVAFSNEDDDALMAGSLSRRQDGMRLKFSATSHEQGIRLVRALLPDANVVFDAHRPAAGVLFRYEADEQSLGPRAVVDEMGLGYIDLTGRLSKGR